MSRLNYKYKVPIIALGFLVPWVIWKDIDIPVITITLVVAAITVLL